MSSTELDVTENRGLSANALKYIAVVAMLIDHIAWCFVNTYSVLGQVMHVIGRMAAPIMCFFIAEGYHHTRNVKRYLLRLGILAVISRVPFVFMETGQLFIYIHELGFQYFYMQSVIFTFFLGLLALVVIHSKKLNICIKALLLTIIFLLSFIGDWYFFAVVWIIIFDRHRGDIKKQLLYFSISAIIMVSLCMLIMPINTMLFQYGVLLAMIPLCFYNGKRGGSEKFCMFNKWFFYVFYPLHMVILGIIKFYILKIEIT